MNPSELGRKYDDLQNRKNRIRNFLGELKQYPFKTLAINLTSGLCHPKDKSNYSIEIKKEFISSHLEKLLKEELESIKEKTKKLENMVATK